MKMKEVALLIGHGTWMDYTENKECVMSWMCGDKYNIGYAELEALVCDTEVDLCIW